MFKKMTALAAAACLVLLAASAAAASGTGLFGIFSQSEDADERLAVLEEAAELVSASLSAGRCTVEVSQAYYEGNRIYISYMADGTGYMIQDGLVLENDSYADIIAGEETELEDGTVIGWKECIVPDEDAADTRTFYLVFGDSDESRIGFNITRHDYDYYLQGISSAETCRAQAELAMGKVDIKGTVRLISPEQAASWLAWQEGEESTGTDVIGSWNFYQNGEPVSADLYGASYVNGTDEVIFELMFPRMDDLTGLTLVPEYIEGGENADESIVLELMAGE